MLNCVVNMWTEPDNIHPSFGIISGFFIYKHRLSKVRTFFNCCFVVYSSMVKELLTNFGSHLNIENILFENLLLSTKELVRFLQGKKTLLFKFKFDIFNINLYCCILTFNPAKLAIQRWCTGRKWHIPMAVMRRNRVGVLGWWNGTR